MLGSQYGPENEIGLTRNSNSAGTITVEASTLHAAAHAASKACIITSIRRKILSTLHHRQPLLLIQKFQESAIKRQENRDMIQRNRVDVVHLGVVSHAIPLGPEIEHIEHCYHCFWGRSRLPTRPTTAAMAAVAAIVSFCFLSS